MRQIPVKQAQTELKRLVKVKTNQRVTLLTNKKDRSLTITRTNGQLTLTEQGYVDQTVTYPTSVAKHQLMAAFKREFPRSHQRLLKKQRYQQRVQKHRNKHRGH